MKKFFRKIKPLDILFLALSLTIVLVSSFLIYSNDKTELYVRIQSPKGEWIYPLTEDTDAAIEGAAGITHIKIEAGEVFVVGSICKNQTCVSAARLKKHGDWNACLPNKVFLSIESR